jgi:hypothetical protein
MSGPSPRQSVFVLTSYNSWKREELRLRADGGFVLQRMVRDCACHLVLACILFLHVHRVMCLASVLTRYRAASLRLGAVLTLLLHLRGGWAAAGVAALPV